MQQCRVFKDTDGSIRINYPNPKLKLTNETDAEFVDRMGKEAVKKDPSLAGLVFIDVDVETIPADRSKRYAWRIDGIAKKVKVDLSIPKPIQGQGGV